MSLVGTLSEKETIRYHRHLILPDFGLDGQERLKNANVLVVGAGGLACPVLQYLAAAGVGHIGIVDYDVVEASNLQRQILYTTNDIGRLKVEVAKERIQAINSFIKVSIFPYPLQRDNVFQTIEGFDVIVDGTDNFGTRYLVNDACVLKDKINVFASIFRYEGQLAVFNYPTETGRSVNYRDIHPHPPKAGLVPNCAEGGVIGVLAGMMGTMQANEVIKVITGIGQPLINRLFIFDSATFEQMNLKIKPNPTVNIQALEDYENYCRIEEESIAEISVQTFKTYIQNKVDYQLIDVREVNEAAISNIGGTLMPLSELEQHLNKIHPTKKVIVHCKSGKRSIKAIQLIKNNLALTNLYSLSGGIDAFFKG